MKLKVISILYTYYMKNQKFVHFFNMIFSHALLIFSTCYHFTKSPRTEKENMV